MPLTSPNPPATGRPATFSAGRSQPEPQTRPHLCGLTAGVRFWHLASFDAPSVAAVWSLAFAWAVRQRLPFWVLALQVLVVWTVYVGDRLLDARKHLPRWSGELRERHYFHWRHRRMLTPLAVLAACAAAAIALHWMPIGIRERDSLLAVASLVYFTRVHSGALHGGAPGRRQVPQLFSKELLVGVLFTIGCVLPVWSPAHWPVLILPAAYFAALAWLNCRAIERWEGGLPGIARAARWMTLAGAVAALALLPTQPRGALLLFAGAASALLFAWLDGIKDRMPPVALRAAADLVLLTPALLLLAVPVLRP